MFLYLMILEVCLTPINTQRFRETYAALGLDQRELVDPGVLLPIHYWICYRDNIYL